MNQKVVVFDSRVMEDKELVQELVESAYRYQRMMQRTFDNVRVTQEESLKRYFDLKRSLDPFLGITDTPEEKAVWQ